MKTVIALAGNPNSGKTTLFNTLTGSNQFVGNWPGVTVEKKEGRLKTNNDVIITDLPGIYSLSPYTLEEVIARNYLVNRNANVIINIVDATNLERNLYLTTQLLELGLPVVMALNLMDVVRKSKDVINTRLLEEKIAVPIVEISALKSSGISELINVAVNEANKKSIAGKVKFSQDVEDRLKAIQELVGDVIPADEKRWYSVKLFERDSKVLENINLDSAKKEKIENCVKEIETQRDDDAESIITSERYLFVSNVLKNAYKKADVKLSPSDKIDTIVTNRYLGLPIFALVMFLVYWVAMVGVGSAMTDWANDGLFGDGWHLFGIGSKAYNEDNDAYTQASAILEGYQKHIERHENPDADFVYFLEDEETLSVDTYTATRSDYEHSLSVLERFPAGVDPKNYGIWVPGVPVLAENLLNFLSVSEDGAGKVIRGLVLDGIVAGVGAVLGFVPQMFILFFMLAFLESCGYMARIAFVLDRVFRRFGLSGKSFIPLLIATGCGVPGIMASRTIENERDRRMTIMTTTFIPCGAKIPFIAVIAGAVFSSSPLIATSAYFIGMISVIVSGIILKKTKIFSGSVAPFVMELPQYRFPTLSNLLHSMWERGYSFIKKAGTIILLSTIIVWFTSFFGFTEEGFRMLSDDELEKSVLAFLGKLISWIFIPLGFGEWQSTVASITGLVAKENIVGTMGILYSGEGSVYQEISLAFTKISAFSFMVFNLLCAPCFAAVGAIRREMNNRKWTTFAICYQCFFAYCISLVINQIGNVFLKQTNILGLVAALSIILMIVYMLFKPYKRVI